MSELWSLAGRKVLVTGGSQGIGEAIVRMLAKHQVEVWIADLPKAQENAAKLMKELGTNVHWAPMDVNSDELVASAVEAVLADGRPLYGLVNNAGIVGVGGFLAPLDDYRKHTNGLPMRSANIARSPFRK